ncbi:3-ketoacyl-CoA synthase 12-like [Nymphaea colorata]|nr:3-ketoacyl-CoA synthase 12-like [Nymphaea colorata]
MESFYASVSMSPTFWFLSFVILFQLCVFILKAYSKRLNQQCYLLDYVCFKASDDRMLSTEMCGEIIQRNKNLGLEDYKFLLKVIVGSGLGEETYGPKDIIDGKELDMTSLNSGLAEVDVAFKQTLDKLFSKTKMHPSDIDILVVNVSMLSAMPSLASRIINRYKMKQDVKVFNLSGMGCSASLISLDMVRNLFKIHDDVTALVVTSECIGPNWYAGNQRSMLVANCLFRSGCCAMLLTNKRSCRARAKLKLKVLLRTHRGANDDAYGCALQQEDEQGLTGFYLGKSLPQAATEAFICNLRDLAPRILPVMELARYLVNRFLHKKSDSAQAGVDFKVAVDHFCIHPGGAAVINGVGRSLGLSQYDLEPARMALHRFGNTSASGLWYVLGYMEAKKRLKRGDRVLQISFGSGFKCNSAYWEVLRGLEDKDVWEDCVDRYPPETLVNPFLEKYAWIRELTSLPPM